jgi:hypothetical protein
MEYALAGVDLLLHRIGWSVQVPAAGPPVALSRSSGGPWRIPVVGH